MFSQITAIAAAYALQVSACPPISESDLSFSEAQRPLIEALYDAPMLDPTVAIEEALSGELTLAERAALLQFQAGRDGGLSGQLDDDARWVRSMQIIDCLVSGRRPDELTPEVLRLAARGDFGVGENASSFEWMELFVQRVGPLGVSQQDVALQVLNAAELNRRADILPLLETVTRARPENRSFWDLWVMTLRLVGRSEEAVTLSLEMYERGLISNSYELSVLAYSMSRYGREREALDLFEAELAAGSIQPHEQSFVHYGAIAALASEWARMSEVNQILLAIEDTPTRRQRIAFALVQLEQWVEAETQIRRAIEMGGSSHRRQDWELLAQILEASGRTDEASAAQRRALSYPIIPELFTGHPSTLPMPPQETCERNRREAQIIVEQIAEIGADIRIRIESAAHCEPHRR